jgi:hypothetical protein
VPDHVSARSRSRQQLTLAGTSVVVESGLQERDMLLAGSSPA